MIRKIELGNTGEMVSQYVLGTMLMGSVMNETDSYQVLDDYVYRRKGNFLDTANNYAWWPDGGSYTGDESETLLGKWLSERNNRKDLFIATKVGANWKDNLVVRDQAGTPMYDPYLENMEGAAEQVIRQGLEDSLKRLQTDYIDLYYIHVDDRRTPLKETMATLDALVKEGKIRYIGYSNIQTWRLERLFNICETYGYTKPVIIQQEYAYISPFKTEKHAYANHAKEDLFDWMDSVEGVSLAAYSPLLKGIFVNKKRREEWLSTDDYDTAYNRRRLENLFRISGDLGVSPNALVLAWMAKSKRTVLPILGFSKVSQYMENIACLDLDLSQDLMMNLGE